MSELSFKECYELLGVNHNHSWSEIRKAYKTLIQKYHPDRFVDNSQEHSLAEDKIKSLNSAFKTLQKYYKANDKLPPINNGVSSNIHTPTYSKRKKTWENEPSRETNTQKTTTPFNQSKTYDFKHAAHADHSLSRKVAKSVTALILLLLTGFSILFLINSHSEDIALNKKTSQRQPITSSSVSVKQTTNFTSKNKPKKSTSNKFFTVGSSIGDVILAQGKPSKTDGSRWYYGKSIVHFDKGVVTEWERHPNYPLNAVYKNKTQSASGKNSINFNEPAPNSIFPWKKQ